jgi:alkanesulfonate monooxygenase SsuD/methylene tetrahydromethanopterin reductase-like flavin-dependent oxidoreductase (luciferase family)
MLRDHASTLKFGWFMIAMGVPGREHVPLLVEEEPEVLPVVARHFDSMWVQDHFYAFRDPSDSWLECWTALTWLAARYPGVSVGPIVLGVGYRNPALLAKMAATLQLLSEGHFIMGIGAGWREPEYPAYGYPFPPAPVRIQQLDEAVHIMRLMWTEPSPTFHGQHFHIENAYCEPRYNPPPPIMIGGGGEKLLLPLAGRQADIWDSYHGGTLDDIDLETYRRKLDILRRHAAEAGRDPGTIGQSFTIENERLPASREDSANWVTRLRPLVDLGVRQFILGFGHVTDPSLVERFAGEVIAPLRVSVEES